jgi:hypothetical protein
MRLFGQSQKVNSRKFAVASSGPAPWSYATRTAGAPLCAPVRPPLATFVARICCKPLRLATAQLRENFPSAVPGRWRQELHHAQPVGLQYYRGGMERLRYSPHNRQNLVRWLLDKDTPRGPDPRQWVEQADMYQEKYGHDDEIEQASKLLQARLARGR